MSDLERAQEWLGCDLAWLRFDGTDYPRCDGKHGLSSGWPCAEAESLAALLAEVQAEALEDVAEAFASSANRVVKFKGETERTRYANEVAEVLRNRANEVRRG